MDVPRKRGYRIFTVSFPPELAELVDQVAEREHRKVSELLREAFRHYLRLTADEGYLATSPSEILPSGGVEVRGPVRPENAPAHAAPRRATL